MIEDRRKRVYKDGFIALRTLASHVEGCADCLGMCSGGPPCETWIKCVIHIKAANALWMEESVAEKTRTSEGKESAK